MCLSVLVFFFFFNDTATTEIYTLSLHDALPISHAGPPPSRHPWWAPSRTRPPPRSEEHPSELQLRQYLVCRLLLEKKKNILIILLHLLSVKRRSVLLMIPTRQ